MFVRSVLRCSASSSLNNSLFILICPPPLPRSFLFHLADAKEPAPASSEISDESKYHFTVLYKVYF